MEKEDGEIRGAKSRVMENKRPRRPSQWRLVSRTKRQDTVCRGLSAARQEGEKRCGRMGVGSLEGDGGRTSYKVVVE